MFVFISKRDGYWQPNALAQHGKQSFSLQHYTKFECSYFLDLTEKMEPFQHYYIFEKDLILKVFILYKENSCIKKIVTIIFFSAICVFFCYVNIQISVTWGIMFQPTMGSNIYHTHFYLRHINRHLKNSVSKSIVLVIKHAKFQLHRVQPDGVI